MDNKYLLDLLEEVQTRGGGMVLSVGGKTSAVVLSIEKYNQLLLNSTPESLQPKKTILVTGGAGYIGSHTTRKLLEEGHNIVVLDNLSTGKQDYVPEGVTLVVGDVGDINLLRDIFSQRQFDAVVHLAASLEVSESLQKPLFYLDNNLENTFKLLTTMAEYGVKVIVFSSSGCVYGDQEKMPIPEEASLNPKNPYGYSKLLAEQLIGYFAGFLGFRATILRYFNVCGAQSLGELSDTHKDSHVIPIMLSVARGQQEKFMLHGKDYSTYDGTAVRDFVHVQDIALAHSLAIAHALDGPAYKIYNVGTGKGTSVEELLQAVAEVTGRMIPTEVGPRREGDEAMTVADNTKIKTELGFNPIHSSLENIVQTSWKALSD